MGIYDHRASSHNWCHGGLVNEPILPDVNGKGLEPSLQGVPFLDHSCFREVAVEVIPLTDILYVERSRDHKQFTLHVQHHTSMIESVAPGVATLEFRSDVDLMADAWAQALMEKLIDLRRHTAEAPSEKHGLNLLLQWVEWLQFPVKFWLHMTIPDMDRPDRQHLYPVSFVMSMVWLALFAFSVIAACDGIHSDFGISTKILGFTVAAAGTSFPNVFSGMVVARQGKTSMAVANALGANVQNVFLALAIPWAIQSCFITKGPFPMPLAGLSMQIATIYITSLPLLIVYMCCSCSMPRWSGALFLLTYVVYVVFALGQQLSKCPIWPFPCGP